jgi:hypothetical protein
LIQTEHNSLKFLLDQKLATIPQHPWVSKQLGFDFHVEYKLSVCNVAADTLSQRDKVMVPEVMALTTPSFTLFDDIRRLITTDPAYQVPLQTSYKSRQVVGRASTRYHVPYGFGPLLPAEVGFSAATCPMASNFISWLR